MITSLSDSEVKGAFDQAATAATKTVNLGGTNVDIMSLYPSPQDWRDIWIYFLMIDRFNRDDGVPPNHMPYNTLTNAFQGGTYNGIRQHLKYIKDLGAGAIWLSPALKNRQSDNATFHGYGIQDFLQPEPRFASSPAHADEELRALVDEAHAIGLYVIFDIVLNHAGDVFAYSGLGSSALWSDNVRPIEWRDEHGAAQSGWPVIDTIPAGQRLPDGLIWPAELQHNDYFRRKGQGGTAGGDFASLKEFVTDFGSNQGYPVRRALTMAYQYAIARYAVDAFRIDTLMYIERDFAQNFGNAVREYSLSIGKKNFFTFGEVYDQEEKIAQFIGRNTQEDGDLIGVDAALDFPLFYHLPWVAKGFAPPTDLIDVFHRRKVVERDIMSTHGDAGKYFVSFLDNHDMNSRFRAAGSDGSDPYDQQVLLAIAVLFCLQGIPCLYYGTEQALHGHGGSDQCVREALWGKAAAFDTNHPFYKAIQQLSSIRSSQPALRYGRLYFRPISGDGVHFGPSSFAPGVLAFSRILNDREVVVVANASSVSGFTGYILVDMSLHQDGVQFRVANDGSAAAPGQVVTQSGLEIHEIDGTVSTGPARMIKVDLRPMEAQILVV